jgi:EAL domain-containing protein (putative c-di-GMP-specific phosphodiesterase class I)
MDRNDAFVNVLALASTQGEFADVVRDDLAQLGFDLVELEDTERLSERRESFTIPEEINRLAELTLATAKTQFGTFHTWVSGDETA